MSLPEVIKLLTNSIAMPYKVVQTVLGIASIFIEAASDNLSKCEIMGGGDEEGLEEVSQAML